MNYLMYGSQILPRHCKVLHGITSGCPHLCSRPPQCDSETCPGLQDPCIVFHLTSPSRQKLTPFSLHVSGDPTATFCVLVDVDI